MSMIRLIKCQTIMVSLTKGQIKVVNLTKPYPFNIANLIKTMAILMDICPF
jgi:hypothetical protein